MTKLLQIYENFLADTHGGSSSIVGLHYGCGALSRWAPNRWIDEVAHHYTPNTLNRLLHSSDARTRLAATWALFFHGNLAHYTSLGRLLSDSVASIRRSADQARREIAARTQSSWHRKTEQDIEQLLASGSYLEADELASHLIAESDKRGDVYALRAGIRLAIGRFAHAIVDCKRGIQLDPYAYRTYVSLGQCYWHLRSDGAARECYLAASKIFPDWRPAQVLIESF